MKDPRTPYTPAEIAVWRDQLICDGYTLHNPREPMTATATKPKERTIYTVKGTSAGAKVELTKPTDAALQKAEAICCNLFSAPGIAAKAEAIRVLRESTGLVIDSEPPGSIEDEE